MFRFMQTFAERLREAREAKGLSQSELARLVDISAQAIQAIEAGRVQSSRATPKIAEALGVSAIWLSDGTGDMVTIDKDSGIINQEQPTTFQSSEMVDAVISSARIGRDQRDLIPVLAAARGGDDQEMFVDDGPIDWVPRPGPLVGVQEAYAMQVTGTSMVPMYKPGQVLWVNPFKRPVAGKGVIVWKHGKAILVKEFVRRSKDHIYLLEYAPDVRTFAVAVGEVEAIHVIVGLEDQ